MRLVICEKSLIKYLLKYVTKAETKSVTLSDILSKLMSSDENAVKGPWALITKILNSYIGERDYS